jgi:hypothetical protein
MNIVAIQTRLFRENIGHAERNVRVLLGAVLFLMVFVVPTAWGWLGAYLALTGLFGSSPLYTLFGVRRNLLRSM